MQSERRHTQRRPDEQERRSLQTPLANVDLGELENNALAEKTIELIDRVRPYLNTILIAAAGVMLAAVGFSLVASQSAANRSQSWDACLSALSGGDIEAFNEVVRRYPGTPAAEWAKLVLADVSLSDGAELLFVDKDRSTPRLQAAVELYTSVIAERPQGMLLERAIFGLAKARESLGQVGEAQSGYEAIAAEFPSGALAQLAAGRAATLKRESSRQWYDWFAAQKISPPAAPPTVPAAGTLGTTVEATGTALPATVVPPAAGDAPGPKADDDAFLNQE